MKKITAYAILFFAGFGSTAGATALDLLSFVPADTSYYIGNSQAMPEKFIDSQMKYIAKMEPSVTKLHKDEKKGSLKSFYNTLLVNFYKEAGKKDGLANIGFGKNVRQALYGLDLFPVLRYQVEDIKKVKEFIKRSETEAKFAIDWQKCAEHDCAVLSTKEMKGYQVAMVLLPQQFAAAFFMKEHKDKYLKHILGKNKPKKSLASTKYLNDLIAKNNYSGYGEGFVKLNELLTLTEHAINNDKRMKNKSKQKKLANCMAFTRKIVEHTPRLVFGIKDLQETTLQGDMVLETSDVLGKYLLSLTDENSSVERVSNPVLDFGINVNMIKTSDALMDLMDFIKKNGTETSCITNTKKISDFKRALTSAVAFGLNHFKGLYIALNDINMPDNKQTKPNFDALVSIYADKLPLLLKKLTLFVPPLAQLDIKADGNEKKLPAGVMPKDAPALAYAVYADKLNVFASHGLKPKKLKYLAADNKPGLLHFSVDGKRYYDLIGDIMKKTGSSDSEMKFMSESMKAISAITPSFKKTLKADKRGLVTDFAIDWQ